ncbi:TMV resistance protein N [Morella rubra]|uniref:TMV resistance protein N n=1 Tax=Morella rubra TaxID=262757 RepID=A0A6A1VIP4_9ROSI|nr:TMV resistance protein N [Morella rubra]
MELCGYPLGNLPTNLQLDNLIKLSMQYSSIRKLWEGTKSLSNLKGIDLRWSEHLIEIPDLSGAPNLERLNLEGCKNLTKVHPDIGVHKRLKELILGDCKSLESLPEEINLESVKVINLRYCSRFKKFPDIVGNMTSLEHLLLDGTAIKELPASLKSLSRLSELTLNTAKTSRFFQGKSRGHERILGSAVAHGMPDWFTTRSSGSSVTLEMHQNLDGNRKWIGCALFVVYESHKQEDGNSWILESGNLIYQSFACDIETDEGRLGDFLLLQTPDVASVGPIGFWAFIPVEWFLEQSNNWEGWSYIRASIAVDSLDPSTDSSIVEVKECGARLLYEG